MAVDVGRAKPLFDSDRERFRQLLTAQARVRGLPLTLMVHSDLTVIEKADIEGVGDIGPSAARGRARLRSARTSRRSRCSWRPKSVAAVIKLRGYDDTYLYVARPLDPRVIEQLQATQASVAGIRQSRGAPRRRADRICADVHRHHADRAALGGMDRAEFRQPAGRADPPPDRRRQSGLDRQSLCAGAGAARGGRSLPARRDLQQDDAGAAHAARRPDARARPDRQPPPFHRSGARGRQRRRDRRRRGRQDQHPQPLGREADRTERGRRRRTPI